MSAKTDPLQEQVASTVWEVCAEPFTPTISHASANEVAIAVLPILTEEVRAAAEKAWDDCIHVGRRRWYIGGRDAVILHDSNPYRLGDKNDMGLE